MISALASGLTVLLLIVLCAVFGWRVIALWWSVVVVGAGIVVWTGRT